MYNRTGKTKLAEENVVSKRRVHAEDFRAGHDQLEEGQINYR